MGQVLASTQSWFDATNNAMGMVSFATLMMMFSNNIWQLDFTPRTWVRWMVYFDVVAFLISYAGTCANDLMPNCWQRNAYKVAAGIVWSFKDGLKYGYMAYKAVKLGDIKADWPYYATLVGSLLLYWIFLLTGNGFEGPKCTPLTTSMGPKVALYLYWTLVDIVASLVVLNKMRKAIKMSKDAKIENKEFNSIKFKEEIRLLIASVGMTIVTILSIINAFNPSFNVLSIWRIVFVYIQLLMVLSQKGASGGGSETTSQSQSMKSSKGTKA